MIEDESKEEDLEEQEEEVLILCLVYIFLVVLFIFVGLCRLKSRKEMIKEEAGRLDKANRYNN